MKQQQFDIAFQMHGGGRNSNPFVLKLGARLTVGYNTSDSALLDINVPYQLFQHEVLRYLELTAQVGAKTLNLEPTLTILESDRDELRGLSQSIRDPFAVIHPGASNIQRRWDPKKFAKVADALANKGLDIIITGTPSESSLMEEVASAMDAKSLVCNNLSIKALAALLERAELLVSCDTGPLHLARAVNTPTVGIYWSCNVVTAGPITVTIHRSSIGWNVNCPLCGADCMKEDVHHPKGNCTHETSFVNGISEYEVIEQALSLYY